jgi:crossover junction endodeoxyribonuclease RusA
VTLAAAVTITIPGHPAPKGSLKCVGRRGRIAHVLIEDNANATPWRNTIAGWITGKWPDHAHADPGQPVRADVVFAVDRPAFHYGTGANASRVKASAPTWPATRSSGDVDKLLRLVLDAVQDTDVLPDDAAVVVVTAVKSYAGHILPWPGVRIRLSPAHTEGIPS